MWLRWRLKGCFGTLGTRLFLSPGEGAMDWTVSLEKVYVKALINAQCGYI